MELTSAGAGGAPVKKLITVIEDGGRVALASVSEEQ